MDVIFKAFLISKTMYKENNEWYVRLEFSQERTRPPTIASRDEVVQSLIPLLQQAIRSILPIQPSLLPRMILLLREDEWEKIENKPDIGEEVIIKITDKKEISIEKV